MKTLKKPLYVAVINALLFFVLIILHYSGISVKIGNANAFSALALLVAIIMFSNELTGVLTGMALGIIIDSVSSTPIGFNAITLTLISFLVTLLSHYLFNRNLKSAMALCLICCALYFAARWLVTFAFAGDIKGSFTYLFSFAATSAIYTAVFIIPFFYLEKRLFFKI
ncbi:MAG: rod shape-determining protein MreD [Clostridia bacterium]|nr:rod shape-determining protein MreD [Clostridia bacterium]